MNFEIALKKIFRKTLIVYGSYHLGGSSVNQCYKVLTNEGVYFVKVHEAKAYPDLFKHELLSLKTLALTQTVKVPEVFSEVTIDGMAYLVAEFLEQIPKSKNYWNQLGVELAALHSNTSNTFGFKTNNYLGGLVQRNKNHKIWADFFWNERIEPMLNLSVNNGYVQPLVFRVSSQLQKHFEEIFNDVKPSLIHGDLWSGNIMVNTNGLPVLVDPAACYGHREMDIAMTYIMGALDEQFYKAYEEILPLEGGWEERREAYLFYYHLVHLNLFGSAYLNNVKTYLDKF